VTDEVLVETFEQGLPLSTYFNRQDTTTKMIAGIGLEMYMKMMLKDNYVHADLHPGNLLVREVPNEEDDDLFSDFWSPLSTVKLVVLDVGLVTEMSPVDAAKFVALFKAVVEGNGK
jgi:aarF domain-containing kinase